MLHFNEVTVKLQSEEKTRQIPLKVFAFTVALFAGVSCFIIAWWGIAFGYSGQKVGGLLGQLYLGYTYTPLGSLIGTVWGFFDWGIAGAIFAWLYNRILTKFS